MPLEDFNTKILQKLLEEAVEHHCLTVVRMALRDLKGEGTLRGALGRLYSDLDKMYCSQTPEGQRLRDYLKQRWDIYLANKQ